MISRRPLKPRPIRQAGISLKPMNVFLVPQVITMKPTTQPRSTVPTQPISGRRPRPLALLVRLKAPTRTILTSEKKEDWHRLRVLARMRRRNTAASVAMRRISHRSCRDSLTSTHHRRDDKLLLPLLPPPPLNNPPRQPLHPRARSSQQPRYQHRLKNRFLLNPNQDRRPQQLKQPLICSRSPFPTRLPQQQLLHQHPNGRRTTLLPTWKPRCWITSGNLPTMRN